MPSIHCWAHCIRHLADGSACFCHDSDQTVRHIVDAVTRNLGLHYLKEGRVEEARSLFRTSLERREIELRSDMPGGHESLLMIEPLELLSYADMLAGTVFLKSLSNSVKH